MGNYNLIFTALVPIAVALVAGILRQNRLPNLANEAISYALVLALSALNAYLDNRLVGVNAFSAFLIIVAYAAASVNTAPYQALQGWLQNNIFSIGGKISKPGPGGAPQLDPTELASLIATELQNNAPAIVAMLSAEINRYLAGRLGSVIPPRASATPGAGVMAHQQVESGASSTSGPVPLVPADVAKLPTQASIPAVKPPVQG